MEGDARFGVIILNIHIIIRPRAVLAALRIRTFNCESNPREKNVDLDPRY